ncbi:MAG: DUF262 domain-containing protein [Proteobacteria bacterium]|nr:DUF262 domain-containing protein [Pseudomonadota bacterium]
MQTNSTTFTIAEYCDQMKAGSIIINRDYQRTSTVWPPSARSYLIDTILLSYPIPKFSLYQKTDLKSRRTIKEIVDGQQRSNAIFDFYNDKLRISGRSSFSGKKYSDLAEFDQQNFVEYSLSVDLVVGATDEDIRQMFRRINSYTVPLNPEEQRHAIQQGEFKWYIVEITEKYSTILKDIGVFTERNLSRMADARLFTEIFLAFEKGIITYSKTKLDQYYKDNDDSFNGRKDLLDIIDSVFDIILTLPELHGSVLMKPFNFFTLSLAIAHRLVIIQSFQDIYKIEATKLGSNDIILANLGCLAEALEENQSKGQFKEFVDACSQATNTQKHRERRFDWFCRALDPRVRL